MLIPLFLACTGADVKPSDTAGLDSAGCADTRPTWPDADGDGYGAGTPVEACTVAAGYASVDGDCDDADPARSPGITETCNGIDDDCDGTPDALATWYTDGDGDGYGDPERAEATCLPGSGQVSDGTDCDDADPAVNPGAAETCDGADDDCDGSIDEGMDADGDGFRSLACTDGTDCDDTRAEVHPDAPTDACDDGIDGDCDGEDPSCGFSGALDLADADGKYAAPAGDDLARQLAVGDVTGDGLEDVVAATMLADAFSGGGYVLTRPPAGVAPIDGWAPHLIGTPYTYGAGRSVGVGDVDGDGVGDVALGSPYTSYGMWIVPGPIDADRTVEDDGFLLQGPPNSYSGHGCDLGDVNGDGVADGVVGSYNAVYDGVTVGGVYVAYGPLSGYLDLSTEADAILEGDLPSSLTGRWVRASDDYDGDGLDDLLIVGPYARTGAPLNGVAYVVHGPPAATVDLATDYDARILGVTAGEMLGYGLGGGDVDGDGVADVLLGAYDGGSYQGTATVYHRPGGDLLSSDADITVEGTVTYDQAGTSIDARDIDASGRGELLVGSPSNGRGNAFLFYDLADGAYTTADADASFAGEAGMDLAGTAVRFADTDGDGRSEVYVGATGESSVGAGGGAVYQVQPF